VNAEILAEARAEKAGYLRGKGWTEEQIQAYLDGARWAGWRPPWWKFHPWNKLAARVTGERAAAQGGETMTGGGGGR
jgi:hypothetical protein